MYKNNDQELERNTILNRSGGVSSGVAGGSTFKRTKLQLKKSLSECSDTSYNMSGRTIVETNFHSPVKKKIKNTVAFTQPLHQQSPMQHDRTTLDEFKKFNTVKASDMLVNNSQYLLQQQQRIKEYSNNRNNDVSYSDTYSSSSSDYRTAVVKPTSSSINSSNICGTGKLGSNKTSSKNSLLTRRSTQSLCSCDAETEQ